MPDDAGGLVDLAARVPLQPLSLDWLVQNDIDAAVLRLDAIDPLISGNKWFKLQPYLQARAAGGACGLMSLGGPHSNHLHALAAAGQRYGFTTVGLIRGEERDTPTIRDLKRWGMQLHWLSYGEYRSRHAEGFWNRWQSCYPDLLPVDEGGQGTEAVSACRVLPQLIAQQLPSLGWRSYDAVWLGVGTGTTLAGFVSGSRGAAAVCGALAVPRRYGVEDQIRRLLEGMEGPTTAYRLFDACRKGFGQADPALLAFMTDCEAQSGLTLEPVYTAKTLMALRDVVMAGHYPSGSRLVFVHTGGLQGRF